MLLDKKKQLCEAFLGNVFSVPYLSSLLTTSLNPHNPISTSVANTSFLRVPRAKLLSPDLTRGRFLFTEHLLCARHLFKHCTHPHNPL